MKIEKYDISLDVDFLAHSYTGEETITTEGESDSLLLNVSGPVIDGMELDGSKARALEPSSSIPSITGPDTFSSRESDSPSVVMVSSPV